MPKYRQLHTKIIDSFDFNEMPTDFHRVTWMLLPLILDRDGRGIYNAAWLRSKLYPMREDVTTPQIMDAFVWFVERGMVEVYTVEGKEYFYVKSFTLYQSGLDREAKSNLPAPVMNDSRVSREQVGSSSLAAESASASESAFESESALTRKKSIPEILVNASGLSAIPPTESARAEQIQCLIDAHGADRVEAALKKACSDWVATRNGKGRFYPKTNMGWVDWAQNVLDSGQDAASQQQLVPDDTGRVNL